MRDETITSRQAPDGGPGAASGSGTTADGTSPGKGVEAKLEVIVLPVSDVGRAKAFYDSLGWRLDADFAVGEDFRVVQYTPPGSPASIHFGTGVTQAPPGSATGLFLVVPDLAAARADLVARGVAVSDIFHREGPGQPDRAGLHPGRASYFSYASFSDPDGNDWLLQEVTTRFPGRVAGASFTSAADLAAALRRAEHAHGAHETRLGRRDEDWPAWYAAYLIDEQSGGEPPA